MSRSIETFPFPPSQRAKLQKAGFLTVQDILEVSPLELSKGKKIAKTKIAKTKTKKSVLFQTRTQKLYPDPFDLFLNNNY